MIVKSHENGIELVTILCLSSEPLPTPTVNQSVVETIVNTVGSSGMSSALTRDDIEESVVRNKCDDLCAVYHLIAKNTADQEREIEKQARRKPQRGRRRADPKPLNSALFQMHFVFCYS